MNNTNHMPLASYGRDFRGAECTNVSCVFSFYCVWKYCLSWIDYNKDLTPVSVNVSIVRALGLCALQRPFYAKMLHNLRFARNGNSWPVYGRCRVLIVWGFIGLLYCIDVRSTSMPGAGYDRIIYSKIAYSNQRCAECGNYDPPVGPQFREQVSASEG